MNLRDYHYTIERGVTRLANDKDFRDWACNWMLTNRKLWKDLISTAERFGTTVNMVKHTLRYLYGMEPIKYGDYANMRTA